MTVPMGLVVGGLDVSGAQPSADLIPPRSQTLTYAAAMAVNLALGSMVLLAVTNNTAFQFTAPTQPYVGQLWWLRIANTSGGAHGAGSFSAAFLVPGNIPAIATANHRWFLYRYNGATHDELYRGPTDIPN